MEMDLEPLPTADSSSSEEEEEEEVTVNTGPFYLWSREARENALFPPRTQDARDSTGRMRELLATGYTRALALPDPDGLAAAFDAYMRNYRTDFDDLLSGRSRPTSTGAALYTVTVQNAALLLRLRETFLTPTKFVIKATPLTAQAKTLARTAGMPRPFPGQETRVWHIHQRARRVWGEALTELMIAHLLTRVLLVGGPHIMSPNFLRIVDWFFLPPVTDLAHRSRDYVRNQLRTNVTLYSVSERLFASAANRKQHRLDVFLANARPDFLTRIVRAFSYQVLHFLETWHLLARGQHNDLHVGNVLWKSVRATPTVGGRDWVYQRFFRRAAQVIPRDEHRGRLVKVLDFGRSRMRVTDTLARAAGLPRGTPNPTPLLFVRELEQAHVKEEPHHVLATSALRGGVDVRRFFWGLFSRQTAQWWADWADASTDAEWALIEGFVDQALGLSGAERILAHHFAFSANPHVEVDFRTAFQLLPGEQLRAYDLFLAARQPRAQPYVRFLNSHWFLNPTVISPSHTHVLDNAFFEVYDAIPAANTPIPRNAVRMATVYDEDFEPTDPTWPFAERVDAERSPTFRQPKFYDHRTLAEQFAARPRDSTVPDISQVLLQGQREWYHNVAEVTPEDLW